MDPDKGSVATAAPPQPSIVSLPTVPQTTVSAEALTDAARATQSLKRQREATPTSPNSTSGAQYNLALSPSKAARIASLTARHSPAPMTGAAAIEDEKRRKEEEYKLQVAGNSENPAYKVQSELLSGNSLAMSRPEDAPDGAGTEKVAENPPASAADSAATPAPAPVSAPAPATPQPTQPAQPAQAAQVAQAAQAELAPSDADHQNITTEGVMGNGVPSVTNSPPPMDIDARSDRGSFGAQPPAQMEEKGTSLSYPGMMQTSASNAPTPPARGMTMPLSGAQQATPKSPNSKKHKCPYCETEFTRHHNLKSHLLTHSQEKPFVCQTCQMRFRRLHDLKRHSKLHTGEKPHVCPKCDRKFARGDALARHSKGPGGCVGRRSSLGGSFLGDDDMEGHSQMEGNDSTMTDVVYDGSGDVDMSDSDRRRLSISGVKAPHEQGGSFTLPIAGSNRSVYAPSGMTESPKPLSPVPQTSKPRSPTIPQLSAAQLSQPNFPRHTSDRTTSPGFNVADAARYAASAATQVNAAASQSGPSTSTAESVPAASSLSQNGGSGDSGGSNNLFATDQGIWSYITSLEEQLRALSDRVQVMETTERAQEEKLGLLTTEVSTLRNQIETAKTTEATEKTN